MGLAGGVYWMARQGLPIMEGSIETDVIQEVEVLRDTLGVPHITAGSMEDLLYAQGYIQAMDRLWQMDLNRRVMAGRLAEIFGEDFLSTDIFLRSLLMEYTAERTVQEMDPNLLDLLQYYVDGINAYMEENSSSLSPEFLLLGYRPREWRIEDTLGIGKYMAWELGGNMPRELFLWTARKELPEELFKELYPSYPEDGTSIIPPGVDISKTDTEELLSFLKLLSSLSTGSPGQAKGSNNWVVGGEKTRSLNPLLANDMHLGMGIPSIWYQTRLEVPGEVTLSGVNFPGVPGIIVGGNGHLCWGVTNLGPDVQDLYLERRHEKDPHLFLYNNSWREAHILQEEFLVKGEKPVLKEIIITHNGPILFDGEEPMSLRWTAHDHTREIEAIIKLMRAKDWESFQEALALFHVPAQNFVMADREGNIGYQATGLIPIRREGDGLLPSPGWDPDYQWQGYIPFEELPTLYNPEEGFIVTANNRVTPPEYPYHISHEWAPPYRADSIREHLVDEEDLTIEDMKELQMRMDNLQAQLLLPHIEEDLYGLSFKEKELQALEVLYKWGEDPVDGVEEAGAAIYHTFYLKALEETFSARMGEDLYREFLQVNPVNIFDRMILEGSLWFEESGGREVVFERAFRGAVHELVERLGDRVEDWEWGDLHQLHLTHYLSQVPVLGGFINDGPYPLGGSHLTVAAAGYSFVHPFEVTVSAPWRFVVDLTSMEENSWENLAGGSHGHPLSPHYRDQTQMWLDGEYSRVFFGREELEQEKSLLRFRLIPKEREG